MDYVELHARSAFSFCAGHPRRSSSRATLRGIEAARARRSAIATACTARRGSMPPRSEHGVRAIVGAELTMEDGTVLPVLVETRTGYQNLCRLITRAKLRGTKTEHAVRWDELPGVRRGWCA